MFKNEIYQFQVLLPLELSMLRPSSILRRNAAHLMRKKDVLKKKPSFDNCFKHAKGLLKHHQFASSFEQWNFINMELKNENKNENSIYYVHFVIFQKYNIIVLSSYDTPCGSFFYCVCTHLGFFSNMLQMSYKIAQNSKNIIIDYLALSFEKHL